MNKNASDEKTKLANRLDEFRKYNDKIKEKYFHLKSVDNFIFHFDGFKDKGKKRQIYATLTDYFDSIFTIDTVDARLSKELFDHYLFKIARLYDMYLKFIPYPKSDMMVVALLGLFGFLYLISASVYAYIVILGVFVAGSIFIRRKKRLKKVYGYFY